MSNFTFTCDTMTPPPAPAAAVPTVPAKAIQVLRPSDRRQVYGPNDPDLQAATLALSGPVFNAPGWNGPSLSRFQDRGKNIAARFDNAQSHGDMRKHWAMADYLGPDAAANPGVRYLLRIRSRYEVANNSYARGIVTTLANDTIGRGPRLHMTTPDVDVNREVKAKFSQWAKEVDLPGKLRTMRMAKAQDGEGFCVQSNRNVTQASLDRGGSPVRLNLRIFEADQCATVAAMMFSVPSVDGIEARRTLPTQELLHPSHPSGQLRLSAGLRRHALGLRHVPGREGLPLVPEGSPGASPRHPRTDPGPEPLRPASRLHQLNPQVRPDPKQLGDHRPDQRSRRPAGSGRGCPDGRLRV